MSVWRETYSKGLRQSPDGSDCIVVPAGGSRSLVQGLAVLCQHIVHLYVPAVEPDRQDVCLLSMEVQAHDSCSMQTGYAAILSVSMWQADLHRFPELDSDCSMCLLMLKVRCLMSPRRLGKGFLSISVVSVRTMLALSAWLRLCLNRASVLCLGDYIMRTGPTAAAEQCFACCNKDATSH